MRVEPVQKRDLVASVTASGQVRPQNKVDVASDVSGKITELAVRDVIHGRTVANTDALANPESLQFFRDLATKPEMIPR